MKFFKMNGLGNDYIFIDRRDENISLFKDDIIALSDRHFGVGGDGVVLIDDSKIADVKMSIFNSDGTEAEMCGNALRCVGKYFYEKHSFKKQCIFVETLAGIKELFVNIKKGIVDVVKANIGSAKIVGKTAIVCGTKSYDFYLVDVGNPHAVTFDETFDINLYGKVVSCDKTFAMGTNVEKVEILSKDKIRVKVYERGTGKTLACGTGAAASAYAAISLMDVEKKVDVVLDGGILIVEYEDNFLYITGDAKYNFYGEINYYGKT